MSNGLDKLDEEITEGAQSPITGISSAIGAGAILTSGARRRIIIELPAYMLVQVAWFTAFGAQMVLFPYILKNMLGVSGTLLGIAQMSLAAPSVVFILLGGVVAERADGKWLLVFFHVLAGLPAVALAYILSIGGLEYWMMLSYAVAMGTIGAFMMPARDSILNEVVARRRLAGSQLTLQQGVAFATLAQFAAQIAGLWIGGMASSKGIWPLLGVQGAIVAAGAIAALFLDSTQMVSTGRKGIGSVFGDIADGMQCVRKNPVLLSMVVCMFGVGVFVIGSFLVVLPIINADVYNHNSAGLRDIFVTFWAGAFCSSVTLSRFRNIKRPGRLMLGSQLIGAIAILVLATNAPYSLFLGLIFLFGLAGGISIMMSRTVVQDAAPPELLARVLSIYQLGFMAGAPIGAAMMGVIADQAGPRGVIFVPAIGMVVMIIWMIAFTPIWNMKMKPKPAAEPPPPATP